MSPALKANVAIAQVRRYAAVRPLGRNLPCGAAYAKLMLPVTVAERPLQPAPASASPAGEGMTDADAPASASPSVMDAGIHQGRA